MLVSSDISQRASLIRLESKQGKNSTPERLQHVLHLFNRFIAKVLSVAPTKNVQSFLLLLLTM